MPVQQWVEERKDNYLLSLGRMSKAYAYINPLACPRVLPEIWQVDNEKEKIMANFKFGEQER